MADASGDITPPPIPDPVFPVRQTVWRDNMAHAGGRDLAEETPVALVYDASTEAVMMASPSDLEDFAIGFSLTEGLITHPADIRRLDIVNSVQGVEARLWLKAPTSQSLMDRRRLRVGPTGCGLCGVESLDAALKPAPRIQSDFTIEAADVNRALHHLEASQTLGTRTRAMHAAGFFEPDTDTFQVREDVGRHNALDKLAGGLARAGWTAARGAVVLSSRVSVEMVQKTLAIGAPILIAVSAPTALALRVAQAADLTLIAIARQDGFEVFTHPQRIRLAGV